MLTLYSIILITHLLGAVLLFILIIYILAAVKFSHDSKYLQLSEMIGVGTAYQFFSGSLLSLMSPEQSNLLSFCSKIIIYLAALTAVELLLYIKMRPTAKTFPFRKVISPNLFAACFVFLAIQSYGF